MKKLDFENERKYLMNLMKEADKFFINFGKVDDDAFSEGTIPKKYKELTMVAVSIVSKCRECIKYHIKECLDADSNKAELIEAIKMGMMAGGLVTYPYVRYSFKILKELKIIN